jgi:hypothetical protein
MLLPPPDAAESCTLLLRLLTSRRVQRSIAMIPTANSTARTGSATDKATVYALEEEWWPLSVLLPLLVLLLLTCGVAATTAAAVELALALLLLLATAPVTALLLGSATRWSTTRRCFQSRGMPLLKFQLPKQQYVTSIPQDSTRFCSFPVQ